MTIKATLVNGISTHTLPDSSHCFAVTLNLEGRGLHHDKIAGLVESVPDLLAALESLYAMGEHQRTIANGKLVGNTYAKALAAIAKAKGE